MLKRLRPTTPTPSTQSDATSLPFDMDARRESKRKRLSPQTRESSAKGWDGESSIDNEEESIMNDELTGEKHHIPANSNEYKRVNTILHELHTLHQLRFLFSSTHPSNPCIHNQHTLYHPSTPELDRSSTPLKVTTAHPTLAQTGVTPSAPAIAHLPPCTTPKYEASLVTERYGDTNRLLGSLFLSRRQQLDAAP